MQAVDPDAGAAVAAGLPVDAARRAVAGLFRRARLDSPDLDARLLVGHALGLDHAGLVAAAGECLSAVQADAVRALARRRLAREPVARILGWKEFWGLRLDLDPATLVPRPETETVVEAALAAAGAAAGTRELRIADLGTGSGALLLALLHERPNATGAGTDISPGALAAARRNARAVGVAARAAFICCDLGAALAGPFDLIVSNPPYVASTEIDSLPVEVRDHDPRAALDGGPDGLDCYRAIADQVPPLLAPGGHLVVELGAGQADAVAGLLARAGLRVLDARPDLAGIPRALAAAAGSSGAARSGHA